MPNCGLTEVGGRALLDCLDANKTLVVFDVRHNDGIGESLMNRIRQQFEVDPELAGASVSTNGTVSDKQQQQHQSMSLARAEDCRLGERIAFLEQQLQIESLVRLQAEQLNGQLQEQLVCHKEQQQLQLQQPNTNATVPDGYVIVPTNQLSSLFLEYVLE